MEQLYFFKPRHKRESINTVFMVSIERLCVISVIVLLLWIMAFFLGYKRGIRVAGRNQNVDQISVKMENTAPAVITEIPDKEVSGVQEFPEITKVEDKEEIQEEVVVKEEKKEDESPKVYYAIQLATYKNISVAQWHLKRLQDEGLDSYLETKGPYQVLYVGKFSSKGDAQKIIGRLKARFPDCLIRRL